VLLSEVARTGYKAITISWRRYIYLWLLNFYQWPSLYDAITSRRNTTAFWDIAPCSKIEVDRRFRGAYWLHHQNDPNDNAVPTSETSVYFNFTARCYIPEICRHTS
jgi:hypothetical protein